ncbi:MAG: hypothetical protein OQJ98_01940 [Candidatus Pacebacteria bacterium]|nr:hypothetical protein [Candidatus Paceibacterota bacterium]
MNIKMLVGAFGLIVSLSACAATGSQTGFAEPPPEAMQPKIDLKPLSKKVGEKLVGTTWTGNLSLMNCEDAEVRYEVVKYLENANRLLVKVESKECSAMDGNYVGLILPNGRVVVADRYEVRQIDADLGANQETGEIKDEGLFTFVINDRRDNTFREIIRRVTKLLRTDTR